MNCNTSELRVRELRAVQHPVLPDNRAGHYVVLKRNCANYEPAFPVAREGSGSHCNVVAFFFEQEAAAEYAAWKNSKVSVDKITGMNDSCPAKC